MLTFKYKGSAITCRMYIRTLHGNQEVQKIFTLIMLWLCVAEMLTMLKSTPNHSLFAAVTPDYRVCFSLQAVRRLNSSTACNYVRYLFIYLLLRGIKGLKLRISLYKLNLLINEVGLDSILLPAMHEKLLNTSKTN